MSSQPDTGARGRWLEQLMDLDDDARHQALADAGIALEWRETGARLCLLADSEGVLDRDPAALASRLFAGAELASPEPGSEVGRYRLEHLIDEGGMATVWLGWHQDSTLPQRVAVKCLRATLSTPQWRERFVREQRILARLDHRNITRLYDAGISDAGMPYIVMEHIEGRSITEFCDAQRLDLRQRVALFLKVCAAVAYAHRSLIVHRDLKPRNVLVSDDGEPHLLDFGIAKLLDLTDMDAEKTHVGLALLTPAYAAPEQFVHGDITTATDVYGLGAMLHELLTGARARHHADGRLLLPSSRCGAEAARLRGAPSLPRMRRILRGDLDAMLQRALRNEAELRYANAGEFGEDLQRWLDGAPVSARVGTWRYRADKFLRRHWLVLSLIAAALISLVGLTAWSLRESRRADAAASEARREATRAVATRDFVFDLLRDLRPGASLNDLGHLLDQAAELAARRFAADDEVRASVQLAVAELDRGYGRLGASRALLEDAAETALKLQGESSELWLEAEAHLGHTAFREGEFRSGGARLQEALLRYDRAGGVVGAARIRALQQLGQIHGQLGDVDMALQELSEASQLAEKQLPAPHPLRQSALELYGQALAESGRTVQAREVLQRNLALALSLYGERDVAVLSAMETLALRELELGQLQAARDRLLRAHELATSLLKGPHVTAGYVENSLGRAELLLGHPVEAQAAFERALAIFAQLYQPPHNQLAATWNNLGEVAIERGDYPGAVDAFSEEGSQRAALQQVDAQPGDSASCHVGEAMVGAGELNAALAPLERCRLGLQRTPDWQEILQPVLQGALAERALRVGDWVLARSLAQAMQVAPSRPMHEQLQPHWLLAEVAAAQGDRAEAQKQSRLALELRGLRTRPCTVARLFERLARLTADGDDAALRDRLRAASQSPSCPPPAQPIDEAAPGDAGQTP